MIFNHSGAIGVPYILISDIFNFCTFNNMKKLIFCICIIFTYSSCNRIKKTNYKYSSNSIIISKNDYSDKLYGFWLGQCIANWTGLITEMDKIGNIGEIKTGPFYTREDWGKKDLPSIWGEGLPSKLSENIDFVLRGSSEVWGADDDTDIEYIYQHLLVENDTAILTPKMIKDGWIKHIKDKEENFLWVSNQKAFDLMKKGMLPPETSNPKNNEHFNMIDAQLTTEIFGLFSPTRPEFALKMAFLPIRTTAQEDAAWISEFYVIMHSLSSSIEGAQEIKTQINWLASQARKRLPKDSYASKMYDYVKSKYESNIPWEQTRDSIYNKYQVLEKDGYNITSKKIYCNGCFAAGINYAASLISLFYGEGDFKETIKIGTLCGWDSDNPTATWGGLLGFMYGKKKIEEIFPIQLSNKFNIHRTRQGFKNNGLDTFEEMTAKGISIVENVVTNHLEGISEKNFWIIPKKEINLSPKIYE